ncbi:MAG: hypothetical protein AAFO76_07430 [Cyanobacteria bacterium J06607_15]
MTHSHGLLLGAIALLRDYVLKPGLICTYGLLGLNLNIIKANAEDNVLVIHSYDAELSSTRQHQEAIEQGFAEIGAARNIYHEYLDQEYYLRAQREQEFLYQPQISAARPRSADGGGGTRVRANYASASAIFSPVTRGVFGHR